MARRLLSIALLVGALGAARAPGATREEASHAMGLWTPHPIHDTCSAAYHDSFSALGTDGKRYPTWHPPEGEEQGTPCTFGHEHGRDPRGSALLADIEAQYGGVLFGFANQQLDEYNRAERHSDGMRHEDHVGHKIEWENDVEVFESTTNGGEGRRALDIRCDFLMKIHQGTHSADAFANNLHELLYAVQCRDRADGSVGTKLIAYTLVQFGTPGGFSEGGVAGGFAVVKVGPPTPRRSRRPATACARFRRLDGCSRRCWWRRARPPTTRVGSTKTGSRATTSARASGRSPIAYFDPHFAVFLPSRFYWPAGSPSLPGTARTAGDEAAQVGRSIDLCYADDGQRRARGGECDRVPDGLPRVGWDDPRSPFDGVKREFYFNQTTLANARGSGHLVHRPVRRSRQHEAVSGRDSPVRRRGRQPEAQRPRRDRRRRPHLPLRVAGVRQGSLVRREGRARTELTLEQGLGTRG